MIPPYTSAWTESLKAEGEAKGKALGMAEALVMVLESRGHTLTDQTRDRIFSCTDPDQFHTWFDAALTTVIHQELTG
ncbi:hypothetical protein IDM40_26110 [Nocardiopsis sp. HNM0947]|uniref:Uncharacterized protein n=1 Tax=Nocardiopsis coralli TaxID=2772213 RepID=A0ABR9PEA0_9ACTN|nr:hypothetical protein [Nocardiopsis coralli]MBE3002148.1 hypothetical protein [Nocardiopsis coralli]